MAIELKTNRLILRAWKPSDYQEFAKMTSDSKVMKYFPSILSEIESNQLADKIRRLIDKNGWGFWALELKSSSEFIGFVGLHYQDQAIPESPFIEIGWRLSANHWGHGYAPEAATKALKFAFEQLQQPAVYAFTTVTNQPSRRVMQKIGMINTNKNFSHPQLSEDHPLAKHCLYKITLEQWMKSTT
ncbi:GNAT family N-acetyltransferase [Vibrio sp. MA40-2]|uniref:GNAT family N-acetyltransferase n=1 Tax=Vibrio sp. MA40-2 TaxID=3391828 RepID=UPI0039A77F7E